MKYPPLVFLTLETWGIIEIGLIPVPKRKKTSLKNTICILVLKFEKSFFRSIPTTFLPWAKPETACGTTQSPRREGYFLPYFRFSACNLYVGPAGSHEPGTPTTEKTPDSASLREVPRTNPKSELKNIKY